MLGACGVVADRQSDPAPTEVASSPDDECLLLVWKGQDAPQRDFDRANDVAKGGAISCATGGSASQFDAALAAIREAAASGDKKRILAEVGIPMMYIDPSGQRREMTQAEVEQTFDEVFTPEMIELLKRVDLADMTVVPEQGAFFELGAVWLVVDPQERRPRIVTVNSQALGEAAEAARRAAAEKRGTPVPVDG